MDNTKEKKWELISGKLHGELDAIESETFDQWIKKPQHKRLYEKVKTIHQGSKEIRKLNMANQAGSWQKIEKRIQIQKLINYFKQTLQYAAIITVAFLVGTYFSPYLQFNQENQIAKIEVMYGQTSHLFLFDGTEVWLNAGTTFEYPKSFNSNSRNVYIDGEAFFKVAPNKKIPFKVITDQMEVEVLGTSFNVDAYRGEKSQSVVLVEGNVQINDLNGNKLAAVLPGQIAVQSSTKSLSVEDTDPYFHTSWKDGKVAFDGEKISDVAKRLERWYNVEIGFEHERLKTYGVTGTILLNKPIEHTIMALEMLAPIRFEKKEPSNQKKIITVKAK